MSKPLVEAAGTFRPMLRLALPVLAANTLHVLVEYVDTWLAGNYLEGDAPLAAISVIRYTMWLVFTLFTFVSVAATAMTARYVGAGDLPQARRVANQALLLGLVLAATFMTAGWFLIRPLVALLQLEGESARLATAYLQMVNFVLPAIMIEEVGIACLRGAGDMLSGLWAMIAVNVVNILVSSCLLLGLGPFPELGWMGLAIGTVCGRLTGGVIVLVLLVCGRAGLVWRLSGLRPAKDVVARLLRIGVPGGADAIFVVLCHMWYVSIINQLGDRAAAAHGIGISIEALAYMPGAAFQMAAATMAGQFLGARDFRRATRSVAVACLTGVGLMCSAGAMFYLAATPLAEFFLGGAESQVVPVAARLLRIVAISMPALAISMVLAGGLRGAGDTRFPLAITLVGFLGVRIPLAYLFAHQAIQLPGLDWQLVGLGMGVAGAWYAMILDVTLRALLILARFLQGGWRKVEV